MPVKVEDLENLVAVQLGIREVRSEDRIVENLGAESADVVNIVAAVEDKYGITVEEEELPDIVTVADLFNLVRQRIS